MPRSCTIVVILVFIAAFGCADNSHGPENSTSSASLEARRKEKRATAEARDMEGKLAKREGPQDVAPVIIGNTKFVTIHWGKSRGLGQNGGYIAALDATTGAELWILKIYEIKYDPKKEEDVQDVFIESMAKTASGDKLEIRDEEGRTYVVDATSRVVLRR
jgi:PQQ enzyme repeat